MPFASKRQDLTPAQLRCYAVARTLFAPTTLGEAIRRLGFVQADPIRAPARAQDLTLRHRVAGYRAGDLHARYPRLAVEEDFFVNYGFLPRDTAALMHPRAPATAWTAARQAQAAAVLEFVAARGEVHPREVDAAFQHGKTRNWFGGSTNASTQLLDGMHYRGLLRVARRDGGTRRYALARPLVGTSSRDPDAVLDRLVDVVVNTYAPLPARSLAELVSHLRGGVPQWADRRAGALQRARARLPSALVDGQRWYWPAGEQPGAARWRQRAQAEVVRLLAPFDPIAWDRRRFEALWGWAYRFEAYTPAAKRQRGYYALPLLWRDQVLGWANLALRGGRLTVDLGWAAGSAPADAGFSAALDDELQRMLVFLGADAGAGGSADAPIG